MDMGLFPFRLEWFHVLVFLLSIIPLFLLNQRKKEKGGARLPPGPSKLPFIGNLHQLGKFHHISFWKFSQKYGPIMQLQLGSFPTVVISSADFAKEVLKTHDLDLCTRPFSAGSGKFSYGLINMGFSPYNNYWKEMHKVLVFELLGARRAQLFWNAREEGANRLINYLSASDSKPVNLTKKIYDVVEASISIVAFGKSYAGKQKFQDALDGGLNLFDSSPFEDYFPSLGRIVDALSGCRARLDKSFRDFDAFFQMVLDEHLDAARPKPEFEDFVDVLLRLSKDEAGPLRITNDHIKAIIAEVLIAGMDNTALTIEWAMSELVIKNPRVLKKVQAEIRSYVGRKPRVDKGDVANLTYLKMVVKETLRMHPPTPEFPREIINHFKIGGDDGYDIYPQTRIIINAWAIGRDPNSWKNPDEFYPERFEGSDIDFKGQNFELLPFGAGRRMCPGLAMAATTVEFTLANLLHCFDWELPNGMKREDIVMEESIHKKTPLYLVPIKYNWQE